MFNCLNFGFLAKFRQLKKKKTLDHNMLNSPKYGEFNIFLDVLNINCNPRKCKN